MSTFSSSRSRARLWPRSGRPMRPRMRSSARRVVMSCPSSCARRRGGAEFCHPRAVRRGGGSSAVPGRAKRRIARADRREPRRDGGERRSPGRRRSSSSTAATSPTRVVADAGGCLRLSASSSSTVGITRTRFRARASSGCCWRSSAGGRSRRGAGGQRGVSEAYRRAGADARRSSLRPPARSASAAGGSRGQGECDRPGLPADPDRVRVRAGI